MRRILSFSLVLSLEAAAQPQPSAPPPSPQGDYQGVTPGAQALPPHVPRAPKRRGGRQQLVWSGFMLKAGIPTVFLETTAIPEYTVEEAPGTLTITLRGATVPLRNNRLPLDVRGFGTALQEVSTVPVGGDVRVIIKTKDATAPVHRERVEAAAGGLQMLVIELPGADPPVESPALR